MIVDHFDPLYPRMKILLFQRLGKTHFQIIVDGRYAGYIWAKKGIKDSFTDNIFIKNKKEEIPFTDADHLYALLTEKPIQK